MLVPMKTRNMRELEKHWAKEADKKAHLSNNKTSKSAPSPQRGASTVRTSKRTNGPK
jgi:hypothetical protein